MSLDQALSGSPVGSGNLDRPLVPSLDGDDPIPTEPKLAGNYYDAPDLLPNPFNPDFDPWVHDQGGHSLHTEKQTPYFDYFHTSPSPGPSGQVSVPSIESVIDSDCSISVDNVNVNDND
jgi:hypothetical protein